MIHYDSLLQNVTAILLQNATEVYYKMRQIFYYKMRQLLQNATFITNSDSISNYHPQKVPNMDLMCPVVIKKAKQK